MALVSFGELLYAAPVAGAALANTTTATNILPELSGFGSYFLPPNYLKFVGQKLRISATGVVSRGASGTLAIGPRFNNIAINTPPAMVLQTKVDVAWYAEWHITVRALGSLGSLICTGVFGSEAVVGSPLPTAGGSGGLLLPASAAAVSSHNLTIELAFGLFANWSVASPTNSIQLHQATLTSVL